VTEASITTPAATALQDDEDAIPTPRPITGTFASETFRPVVRATLGPGWGVDIDSAPALFLVREGDDSTPEGYVGFLHVREVRDQENFSITSPAPDDMLAWLSAHRDVIVVDGPTDVSVAGIPARQLDVRIDTGGYDVPLFDDFQTEYRDRFRVWELRVNGERLLIVSGATHFSQFEGFVPMMEAALQAVSFE
jgi:hypothetical protein